MNSPNKANSVFFLLAPKEPNCHLINFQEWNNDVPYLSGLDIQFIQAQYGMFC